MISTDYHTDDFYQRMLDIGEKAMGFQMNSGTCEAGPLHGEKLHHHSDSYRVAIDQFSRTKTIPGMIASADLDIKFGTYRFADGIWTWQE